MKLNKILIGLSIAGLSSVALANIGDGANGQQFAQDNQLRASPSQTGGVIFRVCNFSSKPITWDAKPDNSADPLVMGDAVTANPGKCQLLGLRANSDTKGLPAFTVTSTVEGSSETASFHVTSITNIDGKVTKWMAVDKFTAASDHKSTIYANLKSTGSDSEVPLDAIVNKNNTQNLASGLLPDYVLCADADGTGKQCNDWANKR